MDAIIGSLEMRTKDMIIDENVYSFFFFFLIQASFLRKTIVFKYCTCSCNYSLHLNIAQRSGLSHWWGGGLFKTNFAEKKEMENKPSNDILKKFLRVKVLIGLLYIISDDLPPTLSPMRNCAPRTSLKCRPVCREKQSS